MAWSCPTDQRIDTIIWPSMRDRLITHPELELPTVLSDLLENVSVHPTAVGLLSVALGSPDPLITLAYASNIRSYLSSHLYRPLPSRTCKTSSTRTTGSCGKHSCESTGMYGLCKLVGVICCHSDTRDRGLTWSSFVHLPLLASANVNCRMLVGPEVLETTNSWRRSRGERDISPA